MMYNYKIEGIYAELVSRLTTDALEFIISTKKETISWQEFEKLWKEKYPNQSMFLSDLQLK